MIYAPGRFLFIHIPRTAGNTLVAAVAPHAAHCSAIVSTIAGPASSPWRRHARIVELRRLLPDFNDIWLWTVVRNPWDIIASEYRLAWRDVESLRSPDSIGWHDRLRRFEESGRDFETFLRTEYTFLRYSRGFYQYWCCDNGEPLCEPVLYDRLNVEWLTIRDRLDPSGSLLPEALPRINAGAEIPVQWMPSLIDYVGELCKDDVERFGFEPPMTGIHSGH